MGYTREVLSKKTVDPVPTFYTKSFRIDLGESFHLHYRNYRIEFSKKEFDIISKGFFWARIRFLLTGKVSIRPEEHGIKFWDYQNLPDEIGIGTAGVRGDDLSVELQEQTDYIHLHYKGSRIEFTIDEFNEFAKVISESDEKLKNNSDIDSAPRRIGKNHAIQPRGRIDKRENVGGFLTQNELVPENVEHTRKSVIIDRITGEAIPQIDGIDDEIKYPHKWRLIYFGPYIVLHYFFGKIGLVKTERSLLKYAIDWLKH